MSHGPDDIVFLTEHSSSVNSRLASFQPLCTQYQLQKPYPLAEINDTRIQEGLIISDLLYVLLGLEGLYIRYSEKYDPTIESMRKEGPDYKINKHLDSSLKDITKRVVYVSKMYSALSFFTEEYESQIYGQTVHSFVYEIKNFLKTYILFVDDLKVQFNTNHQFTLRQLEQDLRSHISYKISILYDIIKDIYDSNNQRQRETQQTEFDNLINNLRDDLKQTGSVDLLVDASNSSVAKGGFVLSVVQDKITQTIGDLKSNVFLTALFENISKRYVGILNDWITKGILNDPSNEFFITSNLVHDFKVNNLNSEQYWQSKFVIKRDGLPRQFADKDVQLKVLLTGKYLNVLRVCDINKDCFSDELVTSLNSTDLYLVIDEAFQTANRYIIDLFIYGYRFKDTLINLENYFLLNNGSKITEFINISIHELKRQYSQASLSRLKRNFGSVFHDNQDIVFQLLNLTLEKEPIYHLLHEILMIEAIDAEEALHSNNFQSIGTLISKSLDKKPANQDSKSVENLRTVNYINFEIILPFPLNLIVTRTVNIKYQLLFRHILNLHFTDKQLNDSWLEINKNKIWKYKHFDKPVPTWISRARSLHDRMKDFFKIYFSFLTQDVIQINSVSLLEEIDTTNDFEKLSRLVESFLSTIIKNSLLTTDKLIKILSRLIQIINAYCTFLLSLRKVLIMLDHDLLSKYNDRLRDEYDHHKNLERLERLNNYLNEYLDSFSQHLSGLIEGLRFYGGQQEVTFLILAQRLEQSFPSNESND